MRAFRFDDLGLEERRFLPVEPARPVQVSRDAVARREHFPDQGPFPWLDLPDADERIASLQRAGTISAELAELFRFWAANGYVVLEGFYDPAVLDRIWAAYERGIAAGTVKPGEDVGVRDQAQETLPGRALNPHFELIEIRRMLNDFRMVRMMSELLGVQALPFQTIAGHKASQQLAHSDTVHMTTYPLGYLTANWIAFEDIAEDSGPLEYYPGSHKLPYRLSREAGITPEEGRQSYAAYHRKYEGMVQQTIRDHGLKAHHFHARKGDVLIWHANLLHGGSMRRNAARSRKALVCHYFAEGCVCYHDYSGTLSHLHADVPLAASPESAAVTKENFDRAAYLAANEDVRLAGADPWRHWIKHGRREGRRLRP